MMAGDTLITIALADSLFFSIRPGAARGKVILYLLLTMAPFAVVGPLLGPVLDRSRTGRRTVVILSAASRALVCLSMAFHLNGLLLFPEAFAALVLSKTYLITKSALVPSAVEREEELVDANSRLAVLGVVAGFAIAAPGAVLLKVPFLGGDWVLRLAALVFACATVAAFRLARVPEGAPPSVADEREQLRTAGIRLAASGMAVLRGIVGFLTFLVTFGFRQSAGVPAFWFGVVLVSSLSGTFFGNLLAPRIRRLVPEERMLMSALLVVAFVGLVTARFCTRPAVAVLAGTLGVAAAAAKVAFDSIVQRDAPDAARGQTFARFETRFQLFWVLGAAVPVVVTPLTRHIDLGMVVLAFAAAFAAFSYAVGRKAVAHHSAERPAAEQPAAEQPAAEQPAAEQPAAEQPAAEPGAADPA